MFKPKLPVEISEGLLETRQLKQLAGIGGGSFIGSEPANISTHLDMGFNPPNYIFGTRADFKHLEIEPPLHTFMLDDADGSFDDTLLLSKDELRLPYKQCIFSVGTKKNIRFKATQLSPVSIEFEVTQIEGYGNDKYLEKKGKLVFTYILINGLVTPNTLDRPAKPILKALQKILTTLIGLGECRLFKQAVTHDGVKRKINTSHCREGIVFKILDISYFKITSVKPIPKGGTHASPREHWRRGHWRRNRQGDIYWQKPLLINKGVKGRVRKAYRLIDIE